MASNWPTAKLGDVIDLFDSQRVPLNSRQRQERQGKFPYYGAQGIIDHIDGYIFDGRYILVAEDGENLNSKKLPLALFASGKFWVNNHAHILRGKAGLADDTFLLACLNNADIKPFVTGAAQPKLSQGNLRLIEIPLPPLPVQQRIAGILSAYDELIENSQRRIKILESMARALYREWFVHFRFPGHENHPCVASPLGEIPQGWGVKALADVCTRITDGSHFSPQSVEEGYPMASVKDMHDWGINVEGCRRITCDDYENLVRNDCKPLKNDVLIAKDGSYLKHTFVVGEEQDLVILSSIAMLRPNDAIRPNYLCLALRDPVTKARMKGIVSGVAIPRIVLKDFRKFQILVPPNEVQTDWARIVDPMLAMCRKLVSQTENLRRTRGLLLPRLLSGQIEVEAT